MTRDAANDLNLSMAIMLADLNSANILNCARHARLLSTLAPLRDHESGHLMKDLTGDLSRLYRAVLVMERDPEVIRRNTLAAVLMSLSPVVVGVQDLLSTPDFPLWKIGMETLVLGLEVMGTTQYLEAAKLISSTEYECSLWDLECRAMQLAEGRGGAIDLVRQQRLVAEFFDSLRGDKYSHEQRPAVHFLLCLILSIISYSIAKRKLAL